MMDSELKITPFPRPVTLTILDSDATHVQNVGSELKLTCQASAEIAHNKLQWYMDGTMVNVTESTWQYETVSN